MAEGKNPESLTSSLSARFRRKERVARGEDVPETREEELAAEQAANLPVDTETEEDAALDDAELLEKYGVENPEAIDDEAKLENVLNGGFPDRIRQMALRRMWRLNPFFGVVDDMVEYGENYTDAATVIEGMTTAYQVGKGYLQQALDATEKVENAVADALPDEAGKTPAVGSGKQDPINNQAEGDGVNKIETDEVGVPEDMPEDAPENMPIAMPEQAAGQGVDLASHPMVDDPSSVTRQPVSGAGETQEEKRPRARRMQFRKLS